MSRAAARPPMAVVMGDVDVVRALGIAGIRSAYFGPADDAARFSRHVRVRLPWLDPWQRQDEVVAALLELARAEPEPPVLFPQTDATLLLASRHRLRLATGVRLLLADEALIEQVMDKARFAALAARHELPVPAAQAVRPEPGGPPPALDVPFPMVIKPLTRTPAWTALAGSSKALHVRAREDLRTLWPRLAELETDVLAQQLIDGPESRIESFHVYVDARGAIAAEFTGRKIRTLPRRYGQSTAVEVVELPDVAELGRAVVSLLCLKGVAKLDFKRDERGRLHLLEVNPRFTLWHHPGAVAGVNIPAMVFADLTGRERPAPRSAFSPVTWCDPPLDLRAARAAGLSFTAWAGEARRCRAVCGLAWDDPLPFVRGRVAHAARRRLGTWARFSAGARRDAIRRAPPAPPGMPGSSA